MTSTGMSQRRAGRKVATRSALAEPRTVPSASPSRISAKVMFAHQGVDGFGIRGRGGILGG